MGRTDWGAIETMAVDYEKANPKCCWTDCFLRAVSVDDGEEEDMEVDRLASECIVPGDDHCYCGKARLLNGVVEVNTKQEPRGGTGMKSTQKLGEPVLVQHYDAAFKDGYFTRWKIVDADGETVVQGLRKCETADDSKSDLRNVIEFLEALELDQAKRALAGTL